MQAARCAANANDQYTLFSHIRRITPKMPRKNIRLRGPQGQLLEPKEAAQVIADWLATTYQDSNVTPVTQAQPDWIFDSQDLYDCFRGFENNKALAPDFLPSILWRSNASAFAEVIHELVPHWLRHSAENTAKLWGQGVLHFLCKPKKKCDHPDSLRPIALLEPTGKVLMGLIAQHLSEELCDRLNGLPQFAYQRERGCSDAIGRIFDFIDHVMHGISQRRYQHHEPDMNLPRGAVWGGLIVSLDLTKAFDSVSRPKLFQVLRNFDINPVIIRLLEFVYNSTSYQFTFGEHTHNVRTHKGIRQGCKAAPCLWLAYLSGLMYELTERTGWTWLQACNTIFADDWLTHCPFESIAEFHQHLINIGHLFDLLDEYNLCRNISKTVGLVKAAEPLLAQLNRRFLQKSKQGMFLKIPRCNGEFTLIRLQTQQVYLGVVLKFGSYDTLTVRYRLQCARNIAHMLNRWLRGRHGLNSKQRIKLWYQCVFSCLLHGIGHTGFSKRHLTQIDAWCLQQLRGIMKQPPHLTKMNHQQFLSQFHIQDPIIFLRRRLESTLKRETSHPQDKLHPQDILYNWTSHRTETALHTLLDFLPLRRSPDPSPDRPFECIYCAIRFCDLGQLRRHLTRVHDCREGQMRVMNPQIDLVDGQPTCARCHQSFTTWSRLKLHIESICVHSPGQDISSYDEFRALQQTFGRFVGVGLDNLPAQNHLLKKFRSRCAICNHFFTSDKHMKLHWKNAHADVFIAHDELYNDLCGQGESLQTAETPCVFCSKQTKQTQHDCPLLRNLAMLGASDDLQDIPIHATPERLLACPHCDRKFLTQNGLQMHLHKRHAVESKGSITFLVERDCLPKATACAHCGQAFECMSSVERHIRGGKCTEYNPDLPVCTLLSSHERLCELVTNDRLDEILADQSLRELLYLTCGLCQQQFRYRGSLGNHFVSRHPTVVSAVRFEVIDLEEKHRGRELRCYCPTGNGKKSRTHRCVIFQQYAMMRHYIITSNQVIPPMTPEPTATQLVPYLDGLLDEDTDMNPDPMEDTSDADLALLLQETVCQQDDLMEYPALSSDDIVETSGHAKETSIDPAALMFMDLPSYSTSLTLNDNVMDYLHESILTNAPTAIYHIAKGDYLALWQDATALHFMSRNCVCCNVGISFDDAASHMSLHWHDITLLPQSAYHECADKFMRNFTVLPWFQSSPCYQAIVHQILIVRLLVEVWSNGPGRCRDASNLARNLACQRAINGLQTAPISKQCHFSAQHSEEEGTTTRRERSRSRGPRTIETDCKIDITSRGHVGSATSAKPVCVTSQRWTGQLTSLDDGKKSELACGDTQDVRSSKLSCNLDGGHIEGESFQAAGCPEERRDVEGRSATTHPHGGRDSPFPILAPSAKETGSEQGQTLGSQGTHGHIGRDSAATSRSLLSAAISFDEKASKGSGIASRCSVSMDADCDSGSPSSLAEDMLSQHLATRGCGSQAPDGSTEPFSEASGGIIGTKRTLRVCLNKPHLFCWLNAIAIGLGWLGLTVAYPQDRWIQECWLLSELTKFTPAPVELYNGDATFTALLQEWVMNHTWTQQQDAVEFLYYLLPLLAPYFFTGTWVPKWVADDPRPFHDTLGENDVHGDRFAPILFSICLLAEEYSLQSYINYWHDYTGHQRCMIGVPQGTCIYLDRLQLGPPTYKDTTAISIPAYVRMPCYSGGSITWMPFDVVAVTYHTGSNFMNGHWQTSVWQGAPHHRWLHYDDGRLPQVGLHLTEHILQNWSLVWLAYNPQYH